MDDHCGRYELLGEIGRGGMGIVYRAIDPRVNHIVAIKKLVLENIAPEKRDEFKDRFVREVQTISKLKHPNIVQVLDLSLTEGNYFYVMEYLDGDSLRKDLQRRGGKMELYNFLPVLTQVGNALSFAHSMNIVHRDVKPDNIFVLENGTVKLTDFGIARAAEYEDAHLTKTGIMMGTLAYVCPEQLQDAKSVDHRADIFSLGVVAYEALSGTLPFTADGIAATIVKIISQEEKPLHIVDSNISPGISSAVARAMRKKPRERYRSIGEFVKEFTSYVPPDERLELAELLPPRDSSTAGSDLKPFIPTSTQFGVTSVDFEADKHQTKEPDIDQTNVNFNKDPYLSTQAEIPARAIEQNKREFVQEKLDESASTKEQGAYEQKPPSLFAAVPVASRKSYKHPEALQFVTSLQNQNAYTALPGKAKPFIEPAVLACHSGRLAIADGAARTINIFSYDGSNLEGTLRWLFEIEHKPKEIPQQGKNAPQQVTTSRTKFGKLTRPGGLAFDMRGRLFVCDASDQFVRVFDGRGFFQSEFKNIQGASSGLAGITFDSGGLLYVSDSANACIQVFQPETGVWLRSISTKSDLTQRLPGSAYGGSETSTIKKDNMELRLPAGLTTDRLNQIYLADYGASRIFVFNKQGQVIKSFGKKGSEDGELNIPRSVAVDKFDRIYVCDSFNNRLSVFDTAGGFIYNYGVSDRDGDMTLSAPSDIAIDHQFGLVFIADRGNKRVQILRMRQESSYTASHF